jgi:serine protease AprX
VYRRTRRTELAALALAASITALIAATAWAQSAPKPILDPRLETFRASSAEVHVWVEFRDKGLVDDAARTQALARAEAELSPRNRARRVRARVHPLVDERDLPVAETNLIALRALGLAPHAVSRWLNRAAVRVPGDQLGALTRIAGVARVTPVARVRRQSPPEVGEPHDDSGLLGRRLAQRSTAIDHGQLEAAIRQIGAVALHDSGYSGAGVLVCLLDAGFISHDTHEALRNRLPAPGHTRDFVEGDSTVADTTSSHGTWVLGCLAGNLPGTYVGSAYGADLALARTENVSSETPAEMLYWAQGAEWADSLGADLISSSLGYFTFDDPFPDYSYADMDGRTTDISRAAQIAASKGMLLVNSVGNEGASPWHYLLAPADVHGDSLIAVGSVDEFGAVAPSSSFGPSADGRVKPDLAARGVSVPVPSTFGDDTGYIHVSGTSLSAPLVAGLAACILQARPHWSPQQVIRALRETASRSTDPDMRVGFGIPNGARAAGLPEPEFQETLGIRTEGGNPFTPDRGDLRIRFGLSAEVAARSVRVRAHDAAGRAVRTLWSGTVASGSSSEVTWNGRDDDGRSLAPGVYWVAVAGDGDLASARVVLLR